MNRKELIETIFASMQTLQRANAAKFHTLLGRYNITPSQLELLFIVKHVGSISFKELASQMKLTPGAISQLINSLVASGYVSRKEDEKDRRVSHVTLTETGRNNLKMMWQERSGFMLRIMEDLTTEELELMLRIQRQIAAHIENNLTPSEVKKKED